MGTSVDRKRDIENKETENEEKENVVPAENKSTKLRCSFLNG